MDDPTASSGVGPAEADAAAELTQEQEAKVRNDFLFEWFQKFHNNHHVLKSIYKYNKDNCIYNLRYLAMLMHLAVPAEFENLLDLEEDENMDELSEMDIRDLWGASYEVIEERELNLQFLSSLKQFFQDKSLNFSSILKQIFQAVQTKDKAIDSASWESSYWQLLQMLFTGMYLESNPGCDNLYMKDFFEIEIKVDVLLLRMVLEVVSKCLKQSAPSEEAFDNSNFLNSSQKFDRSSILEAIESVETEPDVFGAGRMLESPNRSEFASGRSSNRGLFSNPEESGASSGRGEARRPSAMASQNYSFKIDLNLANQSRDQAQQNLQAIEDEEEDAFMAEDSNTWDVFLDAKKFERREEILQIRKKRKITEELSAIRSHREQKEESQEQFELKNKISRLQEKIEYRDDLIQQGKSREADLAKESDALKETITQKDDEISRLAAGIYQIEVLQQKFAQKDVEIDGLIQRLAEVGEHAADLEEQLQHYDTKLLNKSKFVDELKEADRELRNEYEEHQRTSAKEQRKLELQLDHLNEQIQKAAEVAQTQGVNIIEEMQPFDLNQSVLSALSPSNKRRAGMESLANVENELDVQVNFEDVGFFGGQRGIGSNGISKQSSFVSREHNRDSGPEAIHDFIQQDNSYAGSTSFRDVGDTSFQAGDSSYQEGTTDREQEAQEYTTGYLNNSYYRNQTDEDLLGVESSHEQALLPPSSPARGGLEIDVGMPDEQINIYESDEEDKNASRTNSNEEKGGDLEMQKLSGHHKEEETTRDMGFYELEEKYLHYKRTSAQYEKLYGEYLEKFILCERDKQVLIHKQRRVHYLISKTAGCQAHWDAMELVERKRLLIACSVSLAILSCVVLIS